MSGLSSKTLICIIVGLFLYSAMCITFIQRAERRASELVNEANEEVEKVKDSLAASETENEKLREVIKRASDAVDKAVQLAEEATKSHEERVEIVEMDPEGGDWLTCELPAGVRDAFKDYCAN